MTDEAGKGEKPNSFKKWYSKNKEALAEKRRERYRNDPVYRAKALANRKKQVERTPKMKDMLPDEYVYSMPTLAEHLDISVWKLREWRRRGFFPEPFKHGREIYFTQAQANLLGELDKFLVSKSGRVSDDDMELQEMIGYVVVNW